MTANCLATMNTVDWTALEHARGAAHDVPAALAGIATGTPAIAAAALGSLFDRICDHGSVFDSTVVSVPFLAAIAADSATPVRDGVIELLVEIAASPFDFVTRSDWLTDRTAAIARGVGYGMTVEPACRDAVLAVAHPIVAALPGAPPAAQLWTLALVADLAELHPRLFPAVELHTPDLTDPWVALAHELLRVTVEPAARPAAATAARTLAIRGVPAASEFDQDMVSRTLATVAAHLSRPTRRLASRQLLHRYAEQLPRIVYAPSWRDLRQAI